MGAESPEKRETTPGPSGCAPAWLANVARLRELVTFLIVVAVIVAFHAKTMPKAPGDPWPSVFLSSSNLKAMLVGVTSEAILVVGMTIVIVGGDRKSVV